MAILAASPFNYANADIILRSSDDVDFRAHKLILSMASPVFESMFPFPHPAASAEDNQDGLPIVRLAEKCRTLDSLLRICYPTPDPELDDFEDIAAVLGAAKKYDMEAGSAFALKELMRLEILEKDPFSVFLVTHRLKLRTETLAAAKAMLRHAHPIPTHGNEVPEGLHDMPATVLFQLVQYLERCKQQALRLSRDHEWWDDNRTLLYAPCTRCEPALDSCNGPIYLENYELDVRSVQAALNQVVTRMACRSPALQAAFLRRILLLVDEKSVSCTTCRQNLHYAVRGLSYTVVKMIELRIDKVRIPPSLPP